MKDSQPLNSPGFTRRDLIRIVASAGASAVLPGEVSAAPEAPPVSSEVVYDSHVVFDYSPSEGSYDASDSYLVAPSSLETSDGKFPVDYAESPSRTRTRALLSGAARSCSGVFQTSKLRPQTHL